MDTITEFSEVLGFLGTGLLAVAYVPQIRHLIREHCSAGISIKAYILWFIGSLLFLIHASVIMDLVFVVIQLVNLAAIVTIVICTKRYEKTMCRSHLEAHLGQRSWNSRDDTK